jgi:hypothetical protein
MPETDSDGLMVRIFVSLSVMRLTLRLPGVWDPVFLRTPLFLPPFQLDFEGSQNTPSDER